MGRAPTESTSLGTGNFELRDQRWTVLTLCRVNSELKQEGLCAPAALELHPGSCF